jgi:hypothetical protein
MNALSRISLRLSYASIGVIAVGLLLAGSGGILLILLVFPLLGAAAFITGLIGFFSNGGRGSARRAFVVSLLIAVISVVLLFASLGRFSIE